MKRALVSYVESELGNLMNWVVSWKVVKQKPAAMSIQWVYSLTCFRTLWHHRFRLVVLLSAGPPETPDTPDQKRILAISFFKSAGFTKLAAIAHTYRGVKCASGCKPKRIRIMCQRGDSSDIAARQFRLQGFEFEFAM